MGLEPSQQLNTVVVLVLVSWPWMLTPKLQRYSHTFSCVSKKLLLAPIGHPSLGPSVAASEDVGGSVETEEEDCSESVAVEDCCTDEEDCSESVAVEDCSEGCTEEDSWTESVEDDSTDADSEVVEDNFVADVSTGEAVAPLLEFFSGQLYRLKKMDSFTGSSPLQHL